MRITLLLVVALTLASAGCRKAAENAAADETASRSPVSGSDKPDVAGQAPLPGPEQLLAEAARCGGYLDTSPDPDAGLVRILFPGPGPRDADLESLRPALLASPRPVGLELKGSDSITDAGLAHLKEIGNLRRVALASGKITDAGLEHLAGLGNLEQLSLLSDGITDAGLAHLGKLTGLRKLFVYSRNTTDAGYAHLAGLVNLEEIHVGGFSHDVGDECLSHMAGMTGLRKLEIRGNLTDAGMAHLERLTALRKLEISGPKVTGAGVAHLAPLRKLQSLHFRSSPACTGDELAFLDGMTELTELDLVALDKKGGQHLARLGALKILRIRDGWVEKGGLEGIAGLTGLEELDLFMSRIDNEDIKHLRGLIGLRRLMLGHVGLKDQDLKSLAGLPNLRALDVADNRISDAGLVAIGQIPNLQKLTLTECGITGSGFEELTRLPKLEELEIRGNPVTDEYVPVLLRIRGLREIDFRGTKVTAEGARALKQARATLRVRDFAGVEVVLNQNPTTSPKPAKDDISRIEPAFKLTTEDFAREFEGDPGAAAARYKGKVVELTGVVGSLGRTSSGAPWIEFASESKEKSYRVACLTVDDQPWAKVVPGQKARIKGRVPDRVFKAELGSCVFLETGEYAGVRVSAADLAAEYGTDPEGTKKKYKDRYLVLTGEVVSKEFNSVGVCSVGLKSGNKVKILCIFPDSEKDFMKPIGVGQTITAVGQFGSEVGDDLIRLYTCRPLTKP